MPWAVAVRRPRLVAVAVSGCGDRPCGGPGRVRAPRAARADRADAPGAPRSRMSSASAGRRRRRWRSHPPGSGPRAARYELRRRARVPGCPRRPSRRCPAARVVVVPAVRAVLRTFRARPRRGCHACGGRRSSSRTRSASRRSAYASPRPSSLRPGVGLESGLPSVSRLLVLVVESPGFRRRGGSPGLPCAYPESLLTRGQPSPPIRCDTHRNGGFLHLTVGRGARSRRSGPVPAICANRHTVAPRSHLIPEHAGPARARAGPGRGAPRGGSERRPLDENGYVLGTLAGNRQRRR